jgi:hypothetical protein
MTLDSTQEELWQVMQEVSRTPVLSSLISGGFDIRSYGLLTFQDVVAMY